MKVDDHIIFKMLAYLLNDSRKYNEVIIFINIFFYILKIHAYSDQNCNYNT